MNLAHNPKKYTYTKEELIVSLQEKARELGRTPTCKDIEKDPQMPSVYPYYTMFGSMTNALREAGLTPNRVGMHKKYSDPELLDLLRSKVKSLGRTPNWKDIEADPFMPSFQTYKYHFGSFRDVIKKEGLRPSTRSCFQYTKDELLDMLREKAKTLGHTPMSKEIDLDPNMPSSTTFRKRFGSIGKAIQEAGLAQPEARTFIRYEYEDLLNMLKEKAKELGRTPTRVEVISDPHMPSFSTYVYRFGSFQAACKKAGLPPRKLGKPTKCTDTELLDMLRNKAKELGKPPTWKDFGKDNNMPVHQVYTYRFGGIRKALKKVGLI